MQIGLELISNSSNEDVLVIMLFSLSKLASICTLLTSNHVSAFFFDYYTMISASCLGRHNEMVKGLPNTLCNPTFHVHV
jgi:hypothetical protein